MTEGDLRDRLEEMSYGPGTDLANLVYAFYPDMPPLDTTEGGKALLREAQINNADLVVLDSLSKFVEGDEVDNKTHTAFYNLTGQLLRAAGISMLLIDHMGKDPTAGARGASAKKDNVDLHLELDKTSMGSRLYVRKKRHSWIADQYDFYRSPAPSLGYELVGGTNLDAGVHLLVKRMDELDIDLSLGRDGVRAILSEHDVQARNDTLQEAINYRKERGGPVRTKVSSKECTFCGAPATKTITVSSERTKSGVKKQKVCDECEPQQRRAA
jgi:hypothetical protein